MYINGHTPAGPQRLDAPHVPSHDQTSRMHESVLGSGKSPRDAFGGGNVVRIGSGGERVGQVSAPESVEHDPQLFGWLKNLLHRNNHDDIKTMSLKNGTTVLLVPRPGAETMDIAIGTRAGSLQDPEGKAGGAHLIEHMFFGGTPKRNGKLINQELDAQGGQGNAGTSLTNITFTTSVPNSEVKNALGLFTDIYTHPNSNPKELNKEKLIVEQELQTYVQRDYEAEYERQLLLMGDQPLSGDPGGSVRTVRKLEPEDIHNFSEKYFTGSNTVVLLSGDPKQFNKKMLEKTIGKLEKGEQVNNTGLFTGYRQGALVEVVPDENKTQTDLNVSFPGLRRDDPLTPAAAVLSTLLGGGLSARLNDRLRERDQITYGIYGSHKPDWEYGEFHIATSLSNENLKFGMKEIADEISHVAETITKKEFERAKRGAMNELTLRFAGSGRAAEDALDAALSLQKATTPQQRREMLSKVTLDQVKDAAKKIFDFENIKILAQGPLTDPKPIIEGLVDAGIGAKLTPVVFDESRYLDTIATDDAVQGAAIANPNT